MTEAQIYWLITLPKIAEGIGAYMVIIGVVAFFSLGYISLLIEESRDILKKYIKLSVFAVVLGALLTTFIPSTKELVAIYAIPKVVNNEQVQAIPEKLLELANLKLDDLIQETK